MWFAATVLVIILACCITAFDIRFMGELWREMKNIVHAVIQYNHMDVVANGAAFALEALILCILGSVSFCLRAYSAMAIGFSRPNHKGLFSVAAYIGIGVVLQILGGIVISLLNDSWFHRLLLGWEPQLSAVAAMHLGMWLLIPVSYTHLISPPVGVSRPLASLMRVVLPLPLGPKRPTIRPGSMAKLTPSSACALP